MNSNGLKIHFHIYIHSFRDRTCNRYSLSFRFRILKTTWELNAINLNPITSIKNLFKYLAFGFALAPFSVSATFFRIGSAIILFTYLNIFTIIPALVFWFLNVLLTQNAATKAKKDQISSVYLMSFMGLFVPVYFSPERRKETKSGKRKMITSTQAAFYRNQCLASLLCYAPPLAVCAGIVNEFISFKYDSDIELDFYTFHFVTAVVLVEGILSLLFSLCPGPDMFGRCVGTTPENTKNTETNTKSDSTSKNSKSKDITCAEKDETHTSKRSSVNIDEPPPKDLHKKDSTENVNQKSPGPKKDVKKRNNSGLNEHAVNILIALILLGIVMFPIILSFRQSLFNRPLHEHRSYLVVTDKTNASHIIITELMYIPEDNNKTKDMFDRIEANTEYFEPRTVRASNNLLRFYYESKIRITHRKNWDNDVNRELERKDADNRTKVAAVLLMDYEEFKPSSNWKKAFMNSSAGDTPLFLVRYLDNRTIVSHLSEERPVKIYQNSDDIPEPEWHCDIPSNYQINQKCFKEQNADDDVYKSVMNERNRKMEKWINGKSFMELECKWGDKACKTTFNGKQSGSHVRDYCNGADVNLCPLENTQRFLGGNKIEIPSGVFRNIYWTPDRCNPIDATNKKYIRSCDTDVSSKTVSGWTSLLGHSHKKEPRNNLIFRISGHRFCSIYAEEIRSTICIYKETVNVYCCKNEENCPQTFQGSVVGIKNEKSCSKIQDIIKNYNFG